MAKEKGTQSLSIAAQNNVIRTNYIKAKIESRLYKPQHC